MTGGGEPLPFEQLRLLLDALGLGMEQAMRRLGERPSLPAFRDWIVATAGVPDPDRIARYHAALAGDRPPPSTVAMLAAIATLVVDTVATGYFRRTVARKAAAVVDEPPAEPGRCGDGDLEQAADGHHGHAHGMSVLAPAPATAGDDLVRHRVISQVRTGRAHLARALF